MAVTSDKHCKLKKDIFLRLFFTSSTSVRKAPLSAGIERTFVTVKLHNFFSARRLRLIELNQLKQVCSAFIFEPSCSASSCFNEQCLYICTQKKPSTLLVEPPPLIVQVTSPVCRPQNVVRFWGRFFKCYRLLPLFSIFELCKNKGLFLLVNWPFFSFIIIKAIIMAVLSLKFKFGTYKKFRKLLFSGLDFVLFQDYF